MLEPSERSHAHLRLSLIRSTSPQDEGVEPAGPVCEQPTEPCDDDGQQFAVGQSGALLDPVEAPVCHEIANKANEYRSCGRGHPPPVSIEEPSAHRANSGDLDHPE